MNYKSVNTGPQKLAWLHQEQLLCFQTLLLPASPALWTSTLLGLPLLLLSIHSEIPTLFATAHAVSAMGIPAFLNLLPHSTFHFFFCLLTFASISQWPQFSSWPLLSTGASILFWLPLLIVPWEIKNAFTLFLLAPIDLPLLQPLRSFDFMYDLSLHSHLSLLFFCLYLFQSLLTLCLPLLKASTSFKISWSEHLWHKILSVIKMWITKVNSFFSLHCSVGVDPVLNLHVCELLEMINGVKVCVNNKDLEFCFSQM